MANVTYSAGIDHVSGALAKPGKSGQHSCEKMLLATHRVAATTNNKCNRLYLRTPQKRTTPLSPRELQIRARFTSVAAMIKARKDSETSPTARRPCSPGIGKFVVLNMISNTVNPRGSAAFKRSDLRGRFLCLYWAPADF